MDGRDRGRSNGSDSMALDLSIRYKFEIVSNLLRDQDGRRVWTVWDYILVGIAE